MKKKLLLGLTGLTLLSGENTLLNEIQPEVIDKQDNIVKEISINKEDSKIIKNFYEEIKYTNIITSLGMYDLKAYKLIKDQTAGDYKVEFNLENEYKQISLLFPVVYKDKKIERIVPIFYNTKTKEMQSYQLTSLIKDLKEVTVNKLFPKSSRITLNNPLNPTSEKLLFIESESNDGMNYLKNLYSEDMVTLKNEFKNIKLSLVLVPFNYYGEKNSLQISALLKEYNNIYGNIDIYLDYIADRNEVLKKVKVKYLEIFKENYANDFILEMYKEINQKIYVLSDYFLMKLIKQVENQAKVDIIVIIKKEQDFIENLMKVDFIDNKIAELVKHKGKTIYQYNEIDFEEED